MGKTGDMAGRTIGAALEKLLSATPGPVSIAAGIRVLRSVGVVDSDGDLQSLIGSFAAEQALEIVVLCARIPIPHAIIRLPLSA